jgi:hypothetical protein
MWIDFIQGSIGILPSCAFYQHVTHEVFKSLVKFKYPISAELDSTGRNDENASQNLTREEENALRYVAGHVISKIKRNLEQSSDAGKDDQILCLMEMQGEEWDEDRGTEDWINTIDRGGLWHVDDQVYSFFNVIEEEVRLHFKPTVALNISERRHQTNNVRECMDAAVINNEAVLFYWSLLAVGISDIDGAKLLK